MSQLFRISVFCKDQVGLISAITAKLFDLGINLGDTTFAVLGSGAEFTTLCESPKELTESDLHQHLQDLEELSNAEIAVKPFKMEVVHGPMAKVTHRITVTGGDNPGLVARLSEVFMEFEANIVRLNSEKIPGNGGDIYKIDMAVWIPKGNRQACLATVENTANALQMNCEIGKLDSEAE